MLREGGKIAVIYALHKELWTSNVEDFMGIRIPHCKRVLIELFFALVIKSYGPVKLDGTKFTQISLRKLHWDYIKKGIRLQWVSRCIR